MIPLSLETRRRIEMLFPQPHWEIVTKLLVEECGDALPGTSHASGDFWNRIRFAVLKLSAGDLTRLQQEVAGAKRDWRDTLVAAGFAESATAHRNWFPGRADRD